MPDVPAKFVKILKVLFDNQIEFVVVGGLAMIMHGTDTVTEDLDISFALDAVNCEKICQVMNQHHPRPLAFPPNAQFTITPGLLGRVKFLNLKTDMGAIDLLPLPDGIDSYAGLRQRATEKNTADFSVFVASIEDLIAMKRAANRVKDRLHILELIAVQQVLGERKESKRR